MNQKEENENQEEFFSMLTYVFSNLVFHADFGTMTFTVDYGTNHIELHISKDHTVHLSTKLTLENTTNQDRLEQKDCYEEQ